MNLRSWFKDKYNKLFVVLLFSIVVAFFAMRPINSPWHPFIAGDGLGYYAYLPAKWIHGDPNLDFKWFNRVYKNNYVYSAFETPEDNIIVKYKGKKINKYYPGLSYIWFPFFISAHICTKVFKLMPDGFTWPYQYSMGLACLFYFFVGFIALRQLLLRLFPLSPLIATLTPFFIFYGTHLIDFAFNYNTLSHVYSFAFISLFFYCAVHFKQEPSHRLLTLLFLFLFFVITACIRPLNGLIILTLPAFINWSDLKSLKFERPKALHLVIFLVALGALLYQVYISYLQTGSILSYTYTDEKFNFAKNRFFDSLFSYHMGLLVYVPVFLFAGVGVFFTRPKVAFILGGFFLLVLFVYSSWWYWPITKRAMVDFYAIPTIFLAATLERLRKSVGLMLITVVMLLCVFYYQLKKYQIEKGILTEYTNYKSLFWDNFFQVKKFQHYPVPPARILKSKSQLEDFEFKKLDFQLVTSPLKSGKYSNRLDHVKGTYVMTRYGYPNLLKENYPKHIRLSFDCFFVKPARELHAFLIFLDRDGNHLIEIPFYIKESDIKYDQWDHKEFGYKYYEFKRADKKQVYKVVLQIWNVEGKDAIYIDNAKMEFILTDYRFEPLKDNF